MQWFRVYNEILDDPKIAKMDGETFRCFIYLLAVVSEQETEGVLEMSVEDVAWRLRVSQDMLSQSITYMVNNKIIKKEKNKIIIINWSKRQFSSDDVSTRVKRFRKKQRNVTGNVTCNVIDTDTDTDTDTEKKFSYTQEFETFWKAYPKKSGSKKAASDSWKKLNGNKPPIETILTAIKNQKIWRETAKTGDFRPEWKDPERWIKNRMWEVELSEDPQTETTRSLFKKCPSCGGKVTDADLVDGGCWNCRAGVTT